ncbi:hypothetical protein WA026_000718 [Henosepilachna vigintioctopunctata]|uniref:Uncharacterized protein n=1 Tax=Henosepilachna vigintioctopunctata TaxID=420089 RepID=A0AAW1UZD8_9CUCU
MGSSESKQYKDDQDLPSTPMQCTIKPSNVKNVSEMDPRSPNFNIIRTPIEVAIISNEAEVETNMSQMEIAADPRSPSDQFTRTPILIQSSVSGRTPFKLHNKILDNARSSIYYTPTKTSKIQKDFQINRTPIPPKLLESSPVSRKHCENRKSFVGLLETNIDYRETNLDNYIETNTFSSGLTINTNENFLSSGSIIKQENCDPRSPSTEFLRTPIQIIKKIGEVDLNKVDNDVEVDNQQYEECCNSESLLKIATPCVESIEVEENIITLKSTVENLENNSKVQNTSHDFETFNQENCIDMKNVDGNHSSNLQNKNDIICEDIVNILNDLVGHVETQLKQKEDTEIISIYSENDKHQALIDLTADIREFDRKLTKIIHEDNETFSFRRTPKSEKEEKPRNRTPMKDRNIIEEPKRNKLKVSDKPRKLDTVSKIPIFREKNGENKIQCENTIPLDLGVRKKKKSHQPKWDSDKTLVI